jgi:hypothetical protein
MVRHDSVGPASPLHPARDGNRLEDIVAAVAELLVAKQVNSC